MAADTLIDTGAIIAMIDRNDQWHRLCLAAFQTLRLPLLTSEAVLTEAFHLARNDRGGMQSVWTFVRSGAVTLGTIDDGELPELNALMSRYSDRPMDFADATLVHLAKRESISTIFTVDRADFETYRIDGRRRFRIVPAEQPSRSRG
jgi:predicted nucleic acid-binding protein